MTTGELETLERIVAQCQAKLAAHLPEHKARAFLEEVAHRRQHTAIAAAIEAAAATLRLDLPPEPAGLLTDSEVAVVADGDVRFVSPAVEHYLAAWHVVRRHPNGPRWWRLASRKYLVPGRPGDEVALFVVALWWQDTRSTVVRRLRDADVHFVTELLRRGLVVDEDLRGRTVANLCRRLADGARDEDSWVAVAGSLSLLDADLAVTELENTVRYPNPTITVHRRLTAVDELTARDPARGARNLRLLAENLTGTPRERFDVAGLIGERDRELGVRTMRDLAHTPDMGDLRVDAAIRTGDHTFWPNMVAGDRDLSDDARLRLLVELLRWDRAAAVAAAVGLAATTREETTPVRAAAVIRDADRDTALRIADSVAWPKDRRYSGPARREAVDLIGVLDPGEAMPGLARLSRDRHVDVETRYRAACDILERGGPSDALVDFASDPGVDRAFRVRAAKKVGVVEPAIGGQLLIAVARTCTPGDQDRLTLLRNALELAPDPATEALVDVVNETGTPLRIRTGAVEIAAATLSRQRIAELYGVIVTTTAGSDAAYSVALKAKGVSIDAGERLMAQLAKRATTTAAFQLRAARAAGSHGKPVLRRLADKASSDRLRLEAATALHAVDQKAGAASLWKLVRKRGAGEVRIDAARALDDIEALAHIAQDRGNENIRFRAAVAAMELNHAYGRQLLRQLLQDPTLSARTKEKIRRHLL